MIKMIDFIYIIIHKVKSLVIRLNSGYDLDKTIRKNLKFGLNSFLLKRDSKPSNNMFLMN